MEYALCKKLPVTDDTYRQAESDKDAADMARRALGEMDRFERGTYVLIDDTNKRIIAEFEITDQRYVQWGSAGIWGNARL